MRERPRVLSSALAASLGIHLAALTLIAAVWVPAVPELLGELIPVRLLPMAGDRDGGEARAPAESRERADAPKALAAAPVPPRPEPRAPRESVPAADAAAWLTELGSVPPDALLGPSRSDAEGPKVVALAPGSSSSGSADPGGAPGDPAGVARSLAGLGSPDPLGAGGGSLGAPTYGTNPKPEYPALAREKGYEGVVLLRVRVLPDGKVGEVVVQQSSGHAILDQAALRTVRTWLFGAATRNGIAVPSWVTVPVRFSLGS